MTQQSNPLRELVALSVLPTFLEKSLKEDHFKSKYWREEIALDAWKMADAMLLMRDFSDAQNAQKAPESAQEGQGE